MHRLTFFGIPKELTMLFIKNKVIFCFILILCPIAIYAIEHKSPILTTTAIIEVYDHDDFKGIVLIDRGKTPFGKALPGGKVEYGETVEAAVRREMQEEVNLELIDIRQFHVYSNPERDFRHHSVEVTHLARAYTEPVAGDDTAKAFVVALSDIPWENMAFDHALILRDYLNYKAQASSFAMLKH